MNQLLSRAAWIGLLCVACAFCAGDVFAEGDDADTTGIAWVDGWTAGQAKAKESDKLIFVYFGRHSPT